MSDDQTVFLVDDEPDVRASISMLIRSIGLRVETFESPRDFLESYDPERAGCIVLDMRMPGMSGLQLQERLGQMGLHPPIVMISGHGEIPNAVQAVQNGAVDFLQKPVNDQLLLDRVQQALALDKENRENHDIATAAQSRYDRLTRRERQVLSGVVAGKLNKTIAAELDVSTRTIEIHRANLMEKMEARSLSALMQIVAHVEFVQE